MDNLHVVVVLLSLMSVTGGHLYQRDYRPDPFTYCQRQFGITCSFLIPFIIYSFIHFDSRRCCNRWYCSATFASAFTRLSIYLFIHFWSYPPRI